MRSAPAIVLALGVCLSGCGWQGGSMDVNDTDPPPQLTVRHGAAVYEGCTIDSYSSQRIALASTKRVFQDVILLCLASRVDGSIQLRNTDGTMVTRDAVSAQIDALHALGYRAMLGLTMRDDHGMDYTASIASTTVSNTTWQSMTVAAVQSLALTPDGYEIVLPTLNDNAAQGVTGLVERFNNAFHAHAQIGIFVPPSLTSPSDIPGGDAYVLGALAPLVDQVRLETLDFSCCETPGGGPTTDAGWAVDAARFASGYVGGKLSVSVPLYGTDFANTGITYINWDDANSRAGQDHLTIERTIAGTPHFAYIANNGATHYVWFDDALSTERMLYAWEPPTLGDTVGVVYWGLGAEDPDLWNQIAARYP